jgi:hypothetical protein
MWFEYAPADAPRFEELVKMPVWHRSFGFGGGRIDREVSDAAVASRV